MTDENPIDTALTHKNRPPIPAWRDTFVHFLYGTTGNEPLLLDFLNAILESDGQPPAKAVVTTNPFNPATFVTQKYTILDVKATDEHGGIFVVEFQTTERKEFADRMTFYGSRAFSSQMSRGDAYTMLREVLAIAVTTFEMFPTLRSIHNSFRLTAKANPNVVFTNKLQMHVLEAAEEKIGRHPELLSELPPKLAAWMNFFYYSHLRSEEDMTALLNGFPQVEQAYDQYLKFNQDEQLRALDDAHQIFLHDIATDRENARAEGIAIGVNKGKAEGKADIALSMKREGCDTAFISRITGLSAAEIERLG